MMYVFGNCELDTRLYTLRRTDQTTRLQPRVYKVLTYLLEHRDRVVSKDELCEQVWPNQFIANATLESAIRLVRRAIGDSGREQRIIQTSHGYGYRFVAPVEERRSAEDQVTSTRIIPSPRAPRPKQTLSPFVGRQRELTMLHELLEQVESGRGRVVGLVGEPGTGKSRLLHEFRQSLRTGRVTYLEGRCFANRPTTPYLPMLDIIRQSCKITAGDSSETMTVKVYNHLREIGMDPEERASYLLCLLGIKEGMDQLAALRPDLIRVRTVTTLCRMLLACCRQRPVIAAIEDLHWIDKESEDCIASLAANLAQAPILLLTTFRPAYQSEWLEQSVATQMVIPPLTTRDSLSMIHAGLTQESMPADLEQAILTKAAGNPLLLEELIRLITELESSGPDAPIPDNIRDVLLARIDRLPNGSKRLLQTAGVLGYTFSGRLLEAIWEGPADDLEACLHELEQRAFCSLQRSAEEPIYTFKHELVQEVSYESLLPARRQTLHTAAAQALEVLYATHLEDVSDLLAYHYAQTEQAVKAVEALTRLAEAAAQHGVHTEALTALQEALSRVQHLPRDQQPYCRLDLILRQARSLFAMGQLQDALTLLTQLREPVNQLQDAWLDNRHALLLSQIYSRLENWETAAQHAQRVLDTTTPGHDDATRGQACYVLAQERYWSGHLLEGVEFSQRAVALLKWPEQRAQLGMAHLMLGLNTLLVGDFPRALHAADQARTIGTAIRDPHLPTFADWLTGWAQATCGKGEAAIQACQRSLERAPDSLSAALALGWLGYAYLEQGEPAEAIPLLKQAVQRMQQFQRRRLESLYTTFLCEAYLARDDLDTARELIPQGLSIAQEADYRAGVAWAQRALGRISQAADSLIAAEHHFREALGIFDTMQAHFEVGRTHLDLADLTHLQGNPEAATMHLTKAYKLFEALQVPKYTERTRQRVRELGLSSSTGTFL